MYTCVGDPRTTKYWKYINEYGNKTNEMWLHIAVAKTVFYKKRALIDQQFKLSIVEETGKMLHLYCLVWSRTLSVRKL